VVSTTSWPLYPQERDPVPIVQEAGWALRLVWTGAENLFATGFRYLDGPPHSESPYRLHYFHLNKICFVLYSQTEHDIIDLKESGAFLADRMEMS